MKANFLKKRTNEILNESYKQAKLKVDKAIRSGALDIDSYDPTVNFMILPKIIAIAILEIEADQYRAQGTSFEREVKKEVKNLKLFL